LSVSAIRMFASLRIYALSAVTATADAVVEPKGPNILAEQENDSPRSAVEAGGEEATRSPAPGISAVPEEKGAISSLEDDLSADESPSGDGHTILVELPVNDSLPKWRMFSQHTKSKRGKGQHLTLLACQLTGMSLGSEPEVPVTGPVNIPRSLISRETLPRESQGDEPTSRT